MKSSELTYFDGESDTIPTDFTAASLRQLSREQRNVHSRSAVLSFTADSMLDEPTNALNSINLFSATPLPKDSCQTSCVDACTQTESLSYPSSAQETNHLDLLLEVESLFSAESGLLRVFFSFLCFFLLLCAYLLHCNHLTVVLNRPKNLL